MPLYINGENVSDSNLSVEFIAKNFSELKDASLALGQSVARELTEQDRYLYINEGEFAGTKHFDDMIDLLTTDDATTCHILILRSAESGVACLGHFTGVGTDRGVRDMVSLIVELSGTPHPAIDAHLAGGFHDGRGLSNYLSSQLLQCLQKSDEDIHLKTACITDLNDTVRDGIHWPLIYGLAVNVASGEVTKVTVNAKLRGPDLDIRGAASNSLDRLVNVYDNRHHCLSIGPFHIRSLPHINQWCQASDEHLLWV